MNEASLCTSNYAGRSVLWVRCQSPVTMIYRWLTTPGVARSCGVIASGSCKARELTIKRNSVAVVSDGSAVLGLGNIGAHAAIPVMEGKSLLFKVFADIDAWPICLDTQDVDEILATVRRIAPVFRGINLEDISPPRVFPSNRRCRTSASPSFTTISTAPRSLFWPR